MKILCEPQVKPEKVLVHICCAPDAAYGTMKIAEYFGNIIGFYYNPNIWPHDEYKKRLRETRKISSLYQYELIEGDYAYSLWYESIEGLEGEPEKGKRCDACIRFRLEASAKLSKNLGAEAFTTVLSVSPKKDVDMINRAGREIGEKYGLFFIELDLKKKDGFKESVQISKEIGLYRQNYCGCRYSLRT